jgi:hypothetical protein
MGNEMSKWVMKNVSLKQRKVSVMLDELVAVNGKTIVTVS